MAKIETQRKLLSRCMDGSDGGSANLCMAQKRLVTPRPKKQFRKTYIREWREYRGLTLEALGSRVDLTAGNLSQLERANQGYTQETLEAIAHALQTDVASLLMRDPGDSEAMWSIWDQAKPGQRKQLVEIGKTIVKTGTED